MIEKSPDKVFKTLPGDLFMLLFVEKMAGNKMAFVGFLKHRRQLSANVLRMRTAAGKFTACRGIQRTWNISLQKYLPGLPGQVRIRHGNRRKQSLCIGMLVVVI